ncbi:lipid A Biosynthesis N-terminal domain protein [Candidatus Endolissoclinum faulkneri L2]|uniref:Lipid A Biosynthesis N-terminal domain protein n=1 Tax=Candidatus Endolissoclinum faulkneri L2 TaxID=1193729 RepID=K7YSX1_9PROT|nr:lipid-A-disaccharide synthase N-terminal domain-containing protein [Candidatus Endolissoclinum faulkneri]AFX99684.1 lipid A Biosynthesis N-terminal domain protein [Candidatus Endolissoclinum faulkneri L2]
MINFILNKIEEACSYISNTETMMVTVGCIGQTIFTLRFLVQWLQSEIIRKSVIPLSFWYLSISGGVLLFMYALWRQDLVFIFGQGTGILIYIRNLWIIHKERKKNR